MRNRHRVLLFAASVVWLSCLILGARSRALAASFPERPPAGVFHVDEAGILGSGEAHEINLIAGSLLAEQAIPLLVVTLKDLASHGAAGYTIERYAAALFDHWGIGSQDRNYGMLFLVSRGDRRARIELGGAWGRGYDLQAQQIMESLILREFRSDLYSEGILAGVRGMDAMARGLKLPAPRQPRWILPLSAGVFLVVSALVFSLMHGGRQGWAWMILAALAAILIFLATRAGKTGSRDGDRGGGMGGAFGGGSSGHGGATGSW